MKLLKSVIAVVKETIETHRAPRKLAEPVRMIANKAIAVVTVLTAVLAYLQTEVHVIPEQYQDRVTAFIVGAGAVLAFVLKVASEVMRSKVFAPATVEVALTDAAEASYRTQVQQGVVLDPSQFQGGIQAGSIVTQGAFTALPTEPTAVVGDTVLTDLPHVDEHGDLANP